VKIPADFDGVRQKECAALASVLLYNYFKVFSFFVSFYNNDLSFFFSYFPMIIMKIGKLAAVLFDQGFSSIFSWPA